MGFEAGDVERCGNCVDQCSLYCIFCEQCDVGGALMGDRFAYVDPLCLGQEIQRITYRSEAICAVKDDDIGRFR